MKLIKSKLVEELAARTSTTISSAEKMVNAFINVIYNQLAVGNEVNISGFGKFKVSHRLPRIGVNPRNPSEKITVPELNTPKFVAGTAFKDAVKFRN